MCRPRRRASCWAGLGRRTTGADNRAADPVAVTERRRAAQPRALSETERAEVLEVLHSDRFVDESPATVWATLLDEGTYLASPSTMYRLLRQTHGGVSSGAARPPTRPGHDPSWTRRHPTTSGRGISPDSAGPANGTSSTSTCCWTCSRATCPGWMLATVENAELARRLIDETVPDTTSTPPG